MKIVKQDNFYIIKELNLEYIINLAEENNDYNFDYFINAVDYIDENTFKIHQFFLFELFTLLKYAKQFDLALYLYENSHLKDIGQTKNTLLNNNLANILKYSPKSYQSVFIDKYPLLKSQLDLRGYYLALDTGLGKSFTSFATAMRYGNRVIVISPKSLKINWFNEITTFSNLTENDICIFPENSYTNQKVVLTNFEQVKNLPNVFDKYTFIIIDEAQQLRFADRVKLQNIYNFVINNNIDNILILSGTPVKGVYGELSGAMLLLDRYFDLDAIEYFYKIYNRSSSFGSLLLKHRLALSMLRLTKEKVGKIVSLPPKHLLIEPVNLPNNNDYQITKENTFNFIKQCISINYENLSNNTPEEIKNKLKNIDMNKIDYEQFKELKKINKDYKILDYNRSCIAVSLVNKYLELLRQMILDIYNNKLEFIKQIYKKEKRILLFTMYVDIAETLEKLFKEKITENVFVIHGSKSLEERAQAIKHFKEKPTILIATYGALGYGVTLVEGNIIIYADLPYREADLKQAVDRVYRIGQTRDVYVYYLKINGEHTIQDKRERLIEYYSKQVNALIDDSDFKYILSDTFKRFNIDEELSKDIKQSNGGN